MQGGSWIGIQLGGDGCMEQGHTHFCTDTIPSSRGARGEGESRVHLYVPSAIQRLPWTPSHPPGAMDFRCQAGVTGKVSLLPPAVQEFSLQTKRMLFSLSPSSVQALCLPEVKLIKQRPRGGSDKRLSMEGWHWPGSFLTCQPLVELMRRENENYVFLVGDHPLSPQKLVPRPGYGGGFGTSELQRERDSPSSYEA